MRTIGAIGEFRRHGLFKGVIFKAQKHIDVMFLMFLMFLTTIGDSSNVKIHKLTNVLFIKKEVMSTVCIGSQYK